MMQNKGHVQFRGLSRIFVRFLKKEGGRQGKRMGIALPKVKKQFSCLRRERVMFFFVRYSILPHYLQ